MSCFIKKFCLDFLAQRGTVYNRIKTLQIGIEVALKEVDHYQFQSNFDEQLMIMLYYSQRPASLTNKHNRILKHLNHFSNCLLSSPNEPSYLAVFPYNFKIKPIIGQGRQRLLCF